jgi:hypothetical protein
MRLYDIYGRLVNKNVNRYLIKWDSKSRSILQFTTKQFLKSYWKSYIVYEEFPVFSSLLKVDILNASLKIAIEVNGPQHNQFHYFHNNNPTNYLNSIKRDISKINWLEKNNFQIIEINYNEVDNLSREFFKEKFDVTL